MAIGSNWSLPIGGTDDDFASSIQETADGGFIVAGQTNSFGAGGSDAWLLKLDATGSVVWQKTYGGTGDDLATSIMQIADGGFIVAGQTNSSGAGGSDAWVLKLNADGSIAWQKTYGGTGDDLATSILQTVDGGFIVAGQTNSSGAGGSDAWVLKLNADGSIAWQKTYGGPNDDWFNSIQQTADSGFVAAGQTNSSGAGGSDAWVLKLNADGSIAWQKTYGGTGDDLATSILQTADGGFIVAGHTNSFGAGGNDAWVLKLNADGSIAWQKTYGGPNDDWFNSIQQTADNSFIIAGQTLSFGPYTRSRAWVLKLDASGSVVWQNIYAESGVGSADSVQQTADGGFIVAGRKADAWVLKLSVDGSVVWQKTYGGAGIDSSYSIQQTADGGFIVAGRTNSFGAGGYDAWVLRLDQNGGIIGCSDVIIANPSASVSATSATPSDSGAVIAPGAGSVAATVISASDSGAAASTNCSYTPSYVKWQKTYGGTSDDIAYSIQQTPDGGYIVAGETASSGGGSYDAWVLKLDAAGSAQWQKTYGGTDWDSANSDQLTTDGGYILTGYTFSFGAGGRDAWVLKLDAAGSVQWQKTYGGLGTDFTRSIQQTADGGFIVAGNTDSFGAGGADAWVLKLDASGSVQWQKTYGGTGSDYAWSIRQTADGGFIVAGYTSSLGAGGVDAWVLKLDATGLVQWQRTYGGTGSDYAWSTRQGADGGFIVAGWTGSYGAGGLDAWVLKLDREGGISGCAEIGVSDIIPQSSGAAVLTPVSGWEVANSLATVTSPLAVAADTVITPGEVCSASYTSYLLDVYKEGSGTGAITSSPLGIACGTYCRGAFDSGTPVTLIPVADPRSYFAGWGGACNGSGQVTVDADKSCTATFTSIVDFSGSPRSGLSPLLVNFTDLSTNTPSGWFWNFGDGATSLLQNPPHTYLFPGTYTVELSVTSLEGAGNITKKDYINVNCGSGVQTVRYGIPPSTWSNDSSIQSAYDNAGGGDYIEPMSIAFMEGIAFDLNKSVTLKGGYNCNYSSNAAFTIIIGTITFGGGQASTGTATIENIIVR